LEVGNRSLKSGEYVLKSVIVHFGEGPNSGDYVCWAKRRGNRE
jgi:hypothetical protein